MFSLTIAFDYVKTLVRRIIVNYPSINDFILKDWSSIGTDYCRGKDRQKNLNNMFKSIIKKEIPILYESEYRIPVDGYNSTFDVDVFGETKSGGKIFNLLKAPVTSINKNSRNLGNTTVGEITRVCLSDDYNIKKDKVVFFNLYPKNTLVLDKNNICKSIEKVKKMNLDRVFKHWKSTGHNIFEFNVWYELPSDLLKKGIPIQEIISFFNENNYQFKIEGEKKIRKIIKEEVNV